MDLERRQDVKTHTRPKTQTRGKTQTDLNTAGLQQPMPLTTVSLMSEFSHFICGTKSRNRLLAVMLDRASVLSLCAFSGDDLWKKRDESHANKGIKESWKLGRRGHGNQGERVMKTMKHHGNKKKNHVMETRERSHGNKGKRMSWRLEKVTETSGKWVMETREKSVETREKNLGNKEEKSHGNKGEEWKQGRKESWKQRRKESWKQGRRVMERSVKNCNHGK